ncbi:MAG TPA: glycosyltransferase family 4 protein [Bryobacteraceae bacterium]|jgi:glycosyltransferase involved in cell wall biosynthesis
MRVLLASNASYFPPRGGSTRSNLVWLRHLARNGHQCRVICAAPEPGSSAAREAAEQEISAAAEPNLEIIPVTELARKRGVLEQAIAEFKPDWILVSSEDLAHSLLREAAGVALERIVYLAHTPQFMPFGSESWNPEAKTAQLIRGAAGVVVIGEHMAGYVREHLGVEAAVIHPPIYGAGAVEPRGAGAGGFLLMVNPCRVKGIEIFLALADRFKELPFAAIPGWGTTARDREDLASRKNIRILPNVKRMEDVLDQARLLLMPSLWYEGFGLIAMEALSRGLPVIASDSGGLVEAKRGTRYVVPVRPIRKYRAEFDDRHMPVPESDPQDLAPWVAAVEELLDPVKWREESARSLAAARAFTGKLDAGQFERYLLGLKPAAGTQLNRLSGAQRAVLLEKIRQRRRPA